MCKWLRFRAWDFGGWVRDLGFRGLGVRDLFDLGLLFSVSMLCKHVASPVGLTFFLDLPDCVGDSVKDGQDLMFRIQSSEATSPGPKTPA